MPTTNTKTSNQFLRITERGSLPKWVNLSQVALIEAAAEFSTDLPTFNLEIAEREISLDVRDPNEVRAIAKLIGYDLPHRR